jgi:N-dimethylarginine dimethylaminohydrolase
MTLTDASARPTTQRVSRPRTILMVPPTGFVVDYEINAWMDASVPVDTARAVAQWQGLVSAYRAAGHEVHLLEPGEALPDMVYAANGGTSAGGVFYTAHFVHAERMGESALHEAWQRETGARVVVAQEINEGEGDLLTLHDRVLAGHGFRTDPRAHAELAAATGLEVVSLRLVDPRYYHLDTALTVLDDVHGEIAYLPEAFDDESRAVLERLYPTAIRVVPEQAALFALNAFSDGLHVFHPAAATGYAEQLRERGFEPVPVELDELLKGGGSVKCCTLELRD